MPPPGPRATALQSAFNKALEATLARCTYENFAECFPTPAKGAPDTLRAFWRDFMGRLEEVCKVGVLSRRSLGDWVYRANDCDDVCVG